MGLKNGRRRILNLPNSRGVSNQSRRLQIALAAIRAVDRRTARPGTVPRARHSPAAINVNWSNVPVSAEVAAANCKIMLKENQRLAKLYFDFYQVRSIGLRFFKRYEYSPSKPNSFPSTTSNIFSNLVLKISSEQRHSWKSRYCSLTIDKGGMIYLTIIGIIVLWRILANVSSFRQ